MGLFFVYILKSTACLAILYLFYRLLLSKETFHRFNRVALLGLFLLSAIIPFCQLSIDKPGEIQQSVLDMEQLLLITPFAREITTPFISWIEVGFFIYLTGVVFFFLRSLYSLISIFLLIRKGESVVQKNGIVTVVHILPVAPFSWMKYIVISKQDMEENGREILIHENAHISNHHSIDLIIAELCILFHWFNPASWLFKQELQNIHEYEADETVINQGVDAKQYQLLLIKKAVGTRLYSMANSFNHSSLKKRITMMLREKSSPWARIKYVYVLPLAAIAVAAFARPEISQELEKISSTKISEFAPIKEALFAESQIKKPDSVVTKTIVTKKSGNTALPDTLGIKSIANAGSTVSVDSVVVVGYGSVKMGKNSTFYSLLDSARQKNDIVIRGDSKALSKVLIMIEDKESTQKEMNELDPEKIESLSVLKDGEKLYGDKAKNGVILITLKKDKKETDEKK